MLAMSVRVSPWSALCRVSSEGRRTTTAASSRAMASSGWIVRPISPLGPFTVIRCPSIWTVTPLGRGTGFLPMRDMGRCLLPHHREQLAADTGGAHSSEHVGDGICHAHLTFRPLPTGLAHAGNLPAQRELTKTNAA